MSATQVGRSEGSGGWTCTAKATVPTSVCESCPIPLNAERASIRARDVVRFENSSRIPLGKGRGLAYLRLPVDSAISVRS
jgi:hypothetical protein